MCTEISISFKAYGSLTLTTSFYSKNIHFFQTLAFPQCTGTECQLLPPWCLDHNWAVLTITTQPSEHTVAEEGAWVWTYKLWVYMQSKGSIWISKLMMSLNVSCKIMLEFPLKYSRPWMTLSRYSFFVLTGWLTGVWCPRMLSSCHHIPGSRVCRRWQALISPRLQTAECQETYADLITGHCTMGMQQNLPIGTLHNGN